MTNLYDWSLSKKIAFRFTFIFSLSFIFVKNNDAFPFFSYIGNHINTLFDSLTPWFAQHVLNYKYDYSIFTNGSGDTSYDWVSLLILILIAAVGSLIWSLIDHKRSNYNRLYYYLTAFIRFYVAFMLFTYGAIKLIHAQMPPPSLNKLMQPLHEFSPMGLAWTYLGFSKGFNIFMGIVEMAGVLLLFRKTMVIGALITMATSINIMAVNYFFDVPVKMLSTALLVFLLFLLLPNLKVLYNFFIQGKAEELVQIRKPIYKRDWINKILLASKILFIAVFVFSQFQYLKNRQEMIAQYYKKTSIHGIFKIDRQNKTIKSIPDHWNYIIFEFEGKLIIRDSNYHKDNLEYVLNEKDKKITIKDYTMNYSIEKNGDITLTRNFDSHKEEIKLIKQNKENFELIKRDFNFIQEYPYNR